MEQGELGADAGRLKREIEAEEGLRNGKERVQC